jgi:CHAT domain-containing protein
MGSVQAGEGVLGLRRAFEIAGARTLITSLWSLDDHTTRQWIDALYAARLKGDSTAAAVRAAGLAILRARRRARLDDHPYYWAPFVAAGDWR